VNDSKKWLDLFMKFIEHLRISSREDPSDDPRGSPLKVWNSQKIFLKELADGLSKGIRIFYVLKARQLGLSTISLAIDIFWLSMHDNLIGALVVDSEKNREVFRATLRQYINSFPKGFFGKSFSIVKGGDNRHSMRFSNGSRLDFLVAGKSKKNWGEGVGYAFAHLTEISSYGNKEGLDSFREALAEKNPNRLFIYESTAKGMNHWKDMYEDAGRDTLSKRRMFIGWWSKELNSIGKKDPRFAVYGVAEPDTEERELMDLVKERHNFNIGMEQLAYYRWRASDESTDLNTIKQNLPWYDGQAFILSGYSFFRVREIQKDLDRIMSEVDEFNERTVQFKGYRMWLGNDFWASRMEHIVDQDRIEEIQLRVWEDPNPHARYVIGCDPAFGRNDWKDRSCISVWRCYADKLVQVAEYADNTYETHQTAWVLAYLAGIYQNCVVNIELTGGAGRAVLREFDALRERLKAEIYQKVTEDRGWDNFLFYARHYLYRKADSFGAGHVKSFDTNGRTKWEIMNQLRDSHSTGILTINSGPLCAELLGVVQDGYEIGAPGRNKDDRVFALALANRAWIDDVRQPMTQEGQTYAIVMNAENVEADDSSQGKMIIDNLVADFFKTAAERVDIPTAEEQWLGERGFIA
jgi:hypothetical protein